MPSGVEKETKQAALLVFVWEGPEQALDAPPE